MIKPPKSKADDLVSIVFAYYVHYIDTGFPILFQSHDQLRQNAHFPNKVKETPMFRRRKKSSGNTSSI